MSYQTQRQKVAEEMSNILPFLKKKDFDYQKLVNELMIRTYASDSVVRDVLDKFASSNLIKIIVTVPDNQVSEWLKEMKEDEEKAKKEAEDVLKDHLPEKEEISKKEESPNKEENI